MVDFYFHIAASVVILLGIAGGSIFIVVEAVDRAKWFGERFPQLDRLATQRKGVFSLLFVVMLIELALAVDLARIETVEPPTIVFKAPPPPQPIVTPHPLHNVEQGFAPKEPFSYTTQPDPEANPGFFVIITAKSRLDNLSFIIECDKPCKLGQSWAIGGATEPVPFTSGPTLVGVRFIIPAALQPDQQVQIQVRSQNDEPVALKKIGLGPPHS
jgi:hypothetical protein